MQGGGNIEKRKQWHNVAGVENARHGNNGTKLQGWKMRDMNIWGKAEYGKPLIVKYM